MYRRFLNLWDRKSLKVVAYLTGGNMLLDIGLSNFTKPRNDINIPSFFPAVFVAPPLEELIYRAPLVSSSLLGFALYSLENIFRMSLSSCKSCSDEVSKIPDNYRLGMGVIGATSQTVICAHIAGIKFIPRILPYTRPILYGLSAISFGTIHILNYDEIDQDALINTFMFQGIGGLNLGYIAMKYGIQYSILSHSMYNFMLLLIIKLCKCFEI